MSKPTHVAVARGTSPKRRHLTRRVGTARREGPKVMKRRAAKKTRQAQEARLQQSQLQQLALARPTAAQQPQALAA